METAGRFEESHHCRFHFGVSFAVNRGAGDQNELHMLFQFVLVEPVRFAQEAPGAVANHGAANPAAGHDAESTGLAGRVQCVQHREPAFDTVPVIVDAAKLSGALQAFAFREWMASMQGTGLDGEALATFATAATQGGAAALGARALQESKAALSADF